MGLLLLDFPHRGTKLAQTRLDNPSGFGTKFPSTRKVLVLEATRLLDTGSIY